MRGQINDGDAEQSFLLKAPLWEAQKRVQFLEQEVAWLEDELRKARDRSGDASLAAENDRLWDKLRQYQSSEHGNIIE